MENIIIEIKLENPYETFCTIDKDFATISEEEKAFRKRLWQNRRKKNKGGNAFIFLVRSFDKMKNLCYNRNEDYFSFGILHNFRKVFRKFLVHFFEKFLLRS